MLRVNIRSILTLSHTYLSFRRNEHDAVQLYKAWVYISNHYISGAGHGYDHEKIHPIIKILVGDHKLKVKDIES